MKSTQELLAESNRVRRHWQRHNTANFTLPPRPTVVAMSIAISRQEGAQGSEIGRMVAEHFDWPVYDRELITRIADDTGLKEELLTSVDEKETNWLVDCVADFSGDQHVSSGVFAYELARVLASISAQGNCVIVGRGAVALLPEHKTLRVGIVAPVAGRVARIAKQRNLSESEAKRHVDSTDRQRIRFVKNHFRKDSGDPALYDVTLNSARLGANECAALIIHALESKREALSQQSGADDESHPTDSSDTPGT